MLGILVYAFFISLVGAFVVAMLNVGKQADAETAQCWYDRKLAQYKSGEMSEEDFYAFLENNQSHFVEYGVVM